LFETEVDVDIKRSNDLSSAKLFSEGVKRGECLDSKEIEVDRKCTELFHQEIVAHFGSNS